MQRLCATVLTLLITATWPAADAGDEQYQFLFGLQRKGMHELVVKEARQFLRDFPGHEKTNLARYRLGASLFELERHDRAAREFKALAKLNDFEFEVEVWFRLGQCQLANEDYSNALHAFAKVKDADDEYLKISALFLSGEASFQLGDFAQSREIYAQVLAAGKDSEHAHDAAYGLAWSWFRLGDFTQTASSVRSFLKNWEDAEVADEMRQLLGEAEMALGNYDRAMATFRSVREGSFRAAALHGEGFALAKLNDDLGAARCFAKIIDEYSQSRFVAEAALHLGIHLIQAGQFRNALIALELPQNEVSAEGFFWKSKARLELGELEPALAELDRINGLDVSAELAERIHLARGDLLFKLNRTDEASDAYRSSGSEYAMHAAAVALFEEGKYRDAVQLTKDQFARYPNGDYLAQSQLTLGESLFVLEEFAQAENVFRGYAERMAESLRSSNANDRSKLEAVDGAWMRVGWCAYKQSDWGNAAETFARAKGSSLGGAIEAEALFMEGRSRENAGEVGGAIDCFAKYLQAYSQGAQVAESLLAMARLHPDEAGLPYLERLIQLPAGWGDRAAVLMDLGDRYTALNRFDDARVQYQLIRAENENRGYTRTALYGEAWASYCSDEFEVSLDCLTKLNQTPGANDGLDLAAVELSVFAAIGAEDMGRASASWPQFVRKCDDEERLTNGALAFAEALKDAGDLKAARSVLKRLVGKLRQPELLVSLRIEGLFLDLDVADLSSAKRNLIAAQALGVDRAGVSEAAFFLAEATYDKGEFESAIELYRESFYEGGDLQDRALYKIGFAQLNLSRNKDAAKTFGDLVARYKRSELFGESLFLLGEASFRDADFVGCAEALQRVVDEIPKHEIVPKALFRLGVALCETQEWKRGEGALAELARRYPKFEQGVEASLWRGRALSQLGSTRSANQAFQLVIAKDNGVLAARARLEIGKAALASKNYESALSEFLKVSLLYSSAEEVAEALLLSGECLESKGNLESAAEQYKELIAKYPDSELATTARNRLQR